jgi:hypothetical protein
LPVVQNIIKYVHASQLGVKGRSGA